MHTTCDYSGIILEKFGVNIDCSKFKGKGKWSDRMQQTFLSQASRWTETVEANVKLAVAQCVPDTIDNIDRVVIPQKSNFLIGFAEAIERLIAE